MKKILIIAIAFLSFQMILAQDSTSVNIEAPKNYSMVDVKPEFPGGSDAFYKFIGKNYNMPNVKGLAGKVYTMFVIEIDGSKGDIKIIRDLSMEQVKKQLEY